MFIGCSTVYMYHTCSPCTYLSPPIVDRSSVLIIFALRKVRSASQLVTGRTQTTFSIAAMLVNLMRVAACKAFAADAGMSLLFKRLEKEMLQFDSSVMTTGWWQKPNLVTPRVFTND